MRIIIKSMIVSIIFISCVSQHSIESKERIANVCINEWLNSNKIDWLKLKRSVIEYSASKGIVKIGDSEDKQLKDILYNLKMNDASSVGMKKNLTNINKISECLNNSLDIHVNSIHEFCDSLDVIKSTSNDAPFYVLTKIMLNVTLTENISPGIVAAGFDEIITKEKLKNVFYQEIIILTLYHSFIETNKFQRVKPLNQ